MSASQNLKITWKKTLGFRRDSLGFEPTQAAN